MKTSNLSDGEKTVLELLKQLAFNNEGKVILHTTEVERKLIPSGEYSLSVSRYIRNLRAKGKLDYPDPRANNHIYRITIPEENGK